MDNIVWTIEPREADIILNALAQRPFAEVNAVIQKLVQQANLARAGNEASSPEA